MNAIPNNGIEQSQGKVLDYTVDKKGTLDALALWKILRKKVLYYSKRCPHLSEIFSGNHLMWLHDSNISMCTLVNPTVNIILTQKNLTPTVSFFIPAAYISLTTVRLELSGRVSFCTVPPDHAIESVYLAPELHHQGVVTEKTCLFGIAAMLWNAADYKLPSKEEPALSPELENMLISMTNEDTHIRPTASDVLQVNMFGGWWGSDWRVVLYNIYMIT